MSDTISGIKPFSRLYSFIRRIYDPFPPPQSPIVVELYGYQGSEYSRSQEFDPVIFPDPKPPIGGFEGYMSDAVLKVLDRRYPPISLSENFIDFGRADFGDKNKCSCLTGSISLANHSDLDIIVKWDEGERLLIVGPQETIKTNENNIKFYHRFRVYFWCKTSHCGCSRSGMWDLRSSLLPR